MDFAHIFTYHSENLLLAQPDLTMSIIVIVWGIVGIMILRIIMMMIIGIYLLVTDRLMIRHRKKILSNLILMKDIQSELEKEIEQATLKAAFQH